MTAVKIGCNVSTAACGFVGRKTALPTFWTTRKSVKVNKLRKSEREITI
jgi:hypothetical protein